MSFLQNNKSVVHIVTESLIYGITVYVFYRKTKSLTNDIAVLTEKIKNFEAIHEEQNKKINELTDLVRLQMSEIQKIQIQSQSAPPKPRPVPSKPQPDPVKRRPEPSNPQPEPVKTQTPFNKIRFPPNFMSDLPVFDVSFEYGAAAQSPSEGGATLEEIDDNLDDELADELKELETSI